MKATNPKTILEKATPLPKPFDPLTPTIFHEPWWLDAASGGCWEEVTVSSGGRTVGRFPFVRKDRLGFRALLAPGLTHFLGPAVDEGNGGTVSRNLRRGEITRDLIEKLPPFGFFDQNCHRGIPDALPFTQKDFSVFAFFTYEIAPAAEDKIWKGMRDKTRNVIRRAQEQTDLIDLEPAAFRALYDANLEKRGKAFNYMFHDHALPAMEAALHRGRGRVLGAQDKSGRTLAAIFYIWDDQTTYYLVTTRTPDAHSGVVSRLIWEAIRESAAHGRIFDFDGVGTNGSVLFYTAFGGEVRPRYCIQRSTPIYSAIRFSLLQSRAIKGRLEAFRARLLG